MQVPMAKVQLVGHLRHLDSALEALYASRSMQLIDVVETGVTPLAVDDEHAHERDRLRFLRAQLDALLALVTLPEGEPVELTPERLERLEGEVRVIAPEVERLGREIEDRRNELEVLPRYLLLLRKLLPLVPELHTLQEYETAALLIDRRHGAVLGDLHAAMAGIAGAQFEIISAPIDDESLGTILLYPRRFAREVAALLGRSQVNRVRLPNRFEGMPLRDAIASMQRREAELPLLIERAEEERADLLRPYVHWPADRAAVGARLEQLAAIRQLGTTRTTFVAQGWMPRRDIDRVGTLLQDRVGSDVALEEVTPSADEAPPVLLENPAAARPFEFLVRLLSLPRAGALDPTRLMSFFLPLFFGIMLGDVAYGVLLFALAGWLRRRFPNLGDLFRVVQYGAAWATVWGVIYGEFLGDLGHRLFGWKPLWINREEAIEPLLLFALAIGAAHIVFGLVLGIFTARRRSERLERIATLVGLAGLFVLVAVAAGKLPSGFVTPGIAVLVIGLVLLIALQGAMGALHLVGAAGNILSYLRLAAIGLASVYLARVANDLGAAAPLWLGVIVAALFHALNLVLGAFSPTIQALRLHYVEFFGKFHEGGGRPFTPFGTRDKRQ
ncbi:MAG: V-type ATP synthase subunit I [Planctomycetota bacterium]|jgi:V/A-type H+-transporting ATPase subunit I